MRVSVVAACLFLCLLGFSSAQDARASIRKETNIPAEGLGPALNALAKDRNFQIVYVTEEIANVRTEGAIGEFTTDEALERLLTGTGLTFRYLDDKTITIGSATTPHERSSQASKATSTGSPDSNANQEGKKSSSGGFRVAQVDQGKGSSAVPLANQASNAQVNPNNPSTGLSEIIVTAQKKSERLQDVPVPVTVINADALVQSNQFRLQDYFSQAPGLNFSSGDRGEPFIAIRGITTSSFANPTVGVTVDDLPFGPTTLTAGGLITPDIDPSDLTRVEVLRGPQGTLYGVSSLGGLIKYVTIDPSTDRVSGSIQGGLSSIYNGNEVGYNVRGAVNVPLSDTVAVRASAFTRLTPGYVDDPALNIRGVNRGDAAGGRLSALWDPSDLFSLKLGALYQQRNTDGSQLVDRLPNLGDLQQTYPRGSGWYDTKYQAYSATMSGRLGIVNWTSLSGYNVTRIQDSVDTTPFFGGLAEEFGVSAAPFIDDFNTKKFTQEIRLSAPLASNVEALLGGFYTHEQFKYLQDVLAVDPSTGRQAGLIAHIDDPGTYQEFAAFMDVTVNFTDRVDVQVGARASHNRQVQSEIDAPPIGGTGIFLIPPLEATGSPVTYLLTPRFRISPDLMIYARLASGYRAGGINLNAAEGFAVPPSFGADKTQNYEVGVKGNLLDHALTFDASLYYIDWRNIQLPYITPAGTGYTTNGGPAKSQGIELSTEAHPLTGLTVTAWIAWNDAELTESFPTASSPVQGTAGDRLPYSSRFSGNASVDQRFSISSRLSGFVGASISYVGDRLGTFQAAPPRQNYPGYTQTDAHAGIKVDSWTGTLFVTNLTDKRGLLGGGLDGIKPYAFDVIQPRTVGASLMKTF